MKDVDAISSSVALLSCQEMQQHQQELHSAPNLSFTADSMGIKAEIFLQGKDH